MVPVIALWQSISDAQRANWTAFANEHTFPSWTGSATRLSGWNWFAKVNFRLNKMDVTLRSDPPDDLTSVRIYDLQVSNSVGYSQITWVCDPPILTTNWTAWAWLSLPHSAARHPSFRMTRIHDLGALFDCTIVISPDMPGYHTVYIQPVSDQGITMTPVPVLINPT
jgi:hypothetical protein